MKAVVESGCISCGLCVSTCPDVFRMNDDGIAEGYADITDATLYDAEDARDSCPVSVISFED